MSRLTRSPPRRVGRPAWRPRFRPRARRPSPRRAAPGDQCDQRRFPPARLLREQGRASRRARTQAATASIKPASLSQARGSSDEGAARSLLQTARRGAPSRLRVGPLGRARRRTAASETMPSSARRAASAPTRRRRSMTRATTREGTDVRVPQDLESTLTGSRPQRICQVRDRVQMDRPGKHRLAGDRDPRGQEGRKHLADPDGDDPDDGAEGRTDQREERRSRGRRPDRRAAPTAAIGTRVRNAIAPGGAARRRASGRSPLHLRTSPSRP